MKEHFARGRHREMMGQEIERAIFVKFLKFKDKSEILYTYREKKLWKKKALADEDFFGGDSNHS